MNMLPNFPRGLMETGGIVRRILGTMNMYVEDMSEKRNREQILSVIPQHWCMRHSMMST